MTAIRSMYKQFNTYLMYQYIYTSKTLEMEKYIYVLTSCSINIQESNKWVVCRVYDSSGGSQSSFQDEGNELSCLDEVFLSLDDFDEVSLPKQDPYITFDEPICQMLSSMPIRLPRKQIIAAHHHVQVYIEQILQRQLYLFNQLELKQSDGSSKPYIHC